METTYANLGMVEIDPAPPAFFITRDRQTGEWVTTYFAEDFKDDKEQKDALHLQR